MIDQLLLFDRMLYDYTKYKEYYLSEDYYNLGELNYPVDVQILMEENIKLSKANVEIVKEYNVKIDNINEKLDILSNLDLRNIYDLDNIDVRKNILNKFERHSSEYLLIIMLFEHIDYVIKLSNNINEKLT